MDEPLENAKGWTTPSFFLCETKNTRAVDGLESLLSRMPPSFQAMGPSCGLSTCS